MDDGAKCLFVERKTMQSQFIVGICLALILSLAVGIEGLAQESAPMPPTLSLPVLTACTHDGEFYLVAKPDGRIKFVRLEDGATVRTVYHCDPKGAVFSPDGGLIATAGPSNGRPAKLKIWNVADGRFVREIETDVHTDIQLSFSPDGKFLASTAAGFRINVWDVATGSRKQSFQANANIARLVFSKRGEILVVIYGDGSARLFPMEKSAPKASDRVSDNN
jgi:WD40 repeat protein